MNNYERIGKDLPKLPPEKDQQDDPVLELKRLRKELALTKWNTDHESRLNLTEKLLKRILKKLQIDAIDKDGKLIEEVREEVVTENPDPQEESFGIDDQMNLL